MRAVVTTPFPGRRDGEAQTETIPRGAIIDGELAEVAVENSWAEAVEDDFAWPVGEDGKPIIPEEFTNPDAEQPRQRRRK